jgi:hypothetical protein
MEKPTYPKEFLELCASVTDKRPRTVINHILEHGKITTDELKSLYGYNHPPRAARDVRERGIGLDTFSVVGPDGRKIAAYKFSDPSAAKFRKMDGRTAFSAAIRAALISKYGCQCAIYLEEVPERALQIDHRVPYEVGGEPDGEFDPEDYMLLSGSANRAKSWSCEHCDNWKGPKEKSVCLSCYWAYPENYTHIATRQIRRLDLMWEGADVSQFERLKADAAAAGQPIPAFVKAILAKIFSI